MSAQSTPAWLASALGRRTGYGNLRVSDAERAEVTDLLAKHYAEGRLDQAEFEARTDLAMHAKTYADLNGLFDDLPETQPSAPPGGGPPGSGRALRHESARGPLARQHRHPLVLVALIVVLAIVVGHALTWPFGPWGWIGLGFGPWLWIVAAVVIVLVLRRRGRL
jgi:uncharacterized membrane protein